MQKIRRGLIIVNTGDGKGKTTAAFGMALRAAGQGLNVLIIQFMKGQKNVGEIKALIKCNLSIEVKRFGRSGFVQSRTCEPLDLYLAGQGLKYFRNLLGGSSYDMVILDEILVAVDFGLIQVAELIRVLESKPAHMHVVLTGRNAHRHIIQLADLVTEMKQVKHPFGAGVRAQIGIEY